MIYIIRQERMMKELSAHAKGKGKGVLNWYINSNDGLIHVYYDYVGVTYLCIVSKQELKMDLRMYLGTDNEILGLYNNIEEPEQEDELLNVPYQEYGDL